MSNLEVQRESASELKLNFGSRHRASGNSYTEFHVNTVPLQHCNLE